MFCHVLCYVVLRFAVAGAHYCRSAEVVTIVSREREDRQTEVTWQSLRQDRLNSTGVQVSEIAVSPCLNTDSACPRKSVVH